MVEIRYYRQINRVSISGHAMSDEKGRDLICASVSTLAEVLGAFVDNMKASGQVRYPTVKLSEGDALIECNSTRYKSSITLVFDAICAGFEHLAHDYPEHVSYEIIGSI